MVTVESVPGTNGHVEPEVTNEDAEEGESDV